MRIKESRLRQIIREEISEVPTIHLVFSPDGPLGWDPSSRTFSVFASEIMYPGGEVTIENPRTGRKMRFTGPMASRDREGDVTHWELRDEQRMNLILTIWND